MSKLRADVIPAYDFLRHLRARGNQCALEVQRTANQQHLSKSYLRGDVPELCHVSCKLEELIDIMSSFDVDRIIEKTELCELISETEVRLLCFHVRAILAEEPNVVTVDAPVVVCGDIHGQFYDLLKIFEIKGPVSETKYVFLGDYVDRGYHSVETITLLFAYKVKYPGRIILIRGNHESKTLTQTYGFYDECNLKFRSHHVYRYFTEVFEYLCIAAVIARQILCLHGGLSPSLDHLQQLRVVDRRQEVTNSNLISDLLWSDPHEENGWAKSPRGAGYLFGSDIVEEFNSNNNIRLICRGHQLAKRGYQWHFNRTLLTIWSAPNYCYRMRNLASVFEIDSKLVSRLILFTEAKTPDKLVFQKTPVPNPEYFV